MNQETFQIFLWVMSAVALVVFIALYFVKAGYGMFRTASWGISINNKLRGCLWKRRYSSSCLGCGEEWSGICRAGIFLFPAVSVCTIFSGPLFFRSC